MAKPADSISIKQAAWRVMPEAYRIASANGALPANARQIMYAARGAILRLTGKDALNDAYFTQVLLPDYIEEHPEDTANWDVVFDDRGVFIEPHTGRAVPLGTVEVRQYLGERPQPRTRAEIDAGLMASTAGPTNRFLDIMFIEKEGFSALFRQAEIAERFDLAIMSTKGMSVTAARMLLDRLAPHIRSVLVLHDFDVSGFSIFGTLGKSARRYRFQNEVPVTDIGLRLQDVQEMGLESERVPDVEWSTWKKKAATLREYGATSEEIDFLARERVELNSMNSHQFIEFIERKLIEHGYGKVVPEDDPTLEHHARDVIARKLLNDALEALRELAEQKAAEIVLPPDLRQQVREMLKAEPSLPWDIAVAEIARRCAEGQTL